MPEKSRPGFHGKLPSRGDFLTRGLPRTFVDPWDGWLQKGIAASRETMGSEWLAIYLESPVWRFVLSAGVCGPAAVAGIFLPSVDKVGRYFPFTVAQMLAQAVPLLSVLEWSEWFSQIEAHALAALDDDGLDPDALHSALASAEAPDSEARAPRPPADGSVAAISIADASRPADGIQALSHELLCRRFSTPALWWSNGSDLCPPLLLVSDGLSDLGSYEAFLNGRVN